MTPKDLVVFVEGAEGHDTRLAFAATLAAQWRAHLIATFVVPALELNRSAGFAMGAGLANMIARHRADAEQALSKTKATFGRLVESNGLTGEWRVSQNESGVELMLHARHASLAVLGRPRLAREDVTRLSLAEDVIFASGRPTLLLPPDWSRRGLPRRIVIGWNAGREATRAVADAMPFLVAAQAVHVVVVPDARIGGPHGADPGADIARHLARHGVPVVLEQRTGADAGAVLLDRCTDLDADLLVMGAVGRSNIVEFVFGGATRTVLATAALPILLSR